MCSLIRGWAAEHTHNVMAFSSRCGSESSITWIHFKLGRREGETNQCFLSRWSNVLWLFQTSPAYTLALISSFIKCDQKEKKIILLLSLSLSTHFSPTHLFVANGTTSDCYNLVCVADTEMIILWLKDRVVKFPLVHAGKSSHLIKTFGNGVRERNEIKGSHVLLPLFLYSSFALSVRRCDSHPVGSKTLKAETWETKPAVLQAEKSRERKARNWCYIKRIATRIRPFPLRKEVRHSSS